MSTELTAARLPKELLRDLRREAHRQSYVTGTDISWVQVLIRAAEQYLRERGEQVMTVVGQ